MQSNDRPKKLLDQAREKLRVKHYAYRTETNCVFWIRIFKELWQKFSLISFNRTIFYASLNLYPDFSRHPQTRGRIFQRELKTRQIPGQA